MNQVLTSISLVVKPHQVYNWLVLILKNTILAFLIIQGNTKILAG